MQKFSWYLHIPSVESQKGNITFQRCSIESQKGPITVQIHSDSALLVNGTYLNSINALLVLNRRCDLFWSSDLCTYQKVWQAIHDKNKCHYTWVCTGTTARLAAPVNGGREALSTGRGAGGGAGWALGDGWRGWWGWQVGIGLGTGLVLALHRHVAILCDGAVKPP